MVSHYFQNTKKPQAGWDNTTWHARLLIKFISNSGHLIVPTSYYLPSLYHMLSTCYYSAADNFTDTRSSAAPGLHHILEYIICSTSCTSSVQILNKTFYLLILSCLSFKLLLQPLVNWDDGSLERVQHISWSQHLFWLSYTKSGPPTSDTSNWTRYNRNL